MEIKEAKGFKIGDEVSYYYDENHHHYEYLFVKKGIIVGFKKVSLDVYYAKVKNKENEIVDVYTDGLELM